LQIFSLEVTLIRDQDWINVGAYTNLRILHSVKSLKFLGSKWLDEVLNCKVLSLSLIFCYQFTILRSYSVLFLNAERTELPSGVARWEREFGVRTSFVANVTSYLVAFIQILQNLYFFYPI